MPNINNAGRRKVRSQYGSSKAESAANTATQDTFEVPQSSGALAVFLIRSQLNPQFPELIASKVSMTSASIRVGKYDAAVNPSCNEAGTVHSVSMITGCDATPSPTTVSMIGRPELDHEMLEVPRSSDGKFYCTAIVKGQENVNVKTLYYNCVFVVVM
jgi:hypothetical protein